MARLASWDSRCFKVRIGAVLVDGFNESCPIVPIRTGCNTVVGGWDELTQSEPKLYNMCAERDLISSCAKHGPSMHNKTMLVYGYHPCAECAKSITYAGIKNVIVFLTERGIDRLERPTYKAGADILHHHGVHVELIVTGDKA